MSPLQTICKSKELPPIIPVFTVLSFTELVRPMRSRPIGQLLTTTVAMLHSDDVKSNTKKVHAPYLFSSFWPHSLARSRNPPFPVLPTKVMADKPDKQCVLALPLGLSTRLKLHQ